MCICEFNGCCSGDIHEYTVIWHYRPRAKYNVMGYDTELVVALCTGHYNACSQSHGLPGLPELYGWDEADALDGLTCFLEEAAVYENAADENADERNNNNYVIEEQAQAVE